MIERVVANFIDLDSGKLLQPPDSPHPLKAQGWQDLGATVPWMEQQGVDATWGSEGLLSLGMTVIPLANDKWEDVSAHWLLDQLAAAAPPERLAKIERHENLPVTYGFKTREGGVGILQFIGLAEDRGLKLPKIRYKLVSTQALSAPIVSGQAGSSANPIYVWCDKGETEAVLPNGGRLRLLAIGDQQHWWTPQGQPLPENPEWQRFRKDLPDSKHIAVVAQLHPEIDPAVAKIGPDGEQLEHLALSAFGISSEPGKRESLIVGFGTGPWQTAPTVLSPAQPGVIKFGEAICGVEKIEEQIAGTPSYAPMTLVSFWLMQPPEVESALVAVGKDGREEALGLTWLAVGAARALPPWQRWDTSGFAHLDLARLELRIRPRAWAGFVGFATQPQDHRVELEKPNTSAAAAARFAPVIEKVLNDLDEGQGNEALHLQTGTLSSVPADAKSVGGVLYNWLKTNHMDLLADYARNRWALLSIGLTLADFPAARWDEATPADLTPALASGTTLERLERSGQVFYLLPEQPQWPVTFAFKTQEGDHGLLQITGATDNPQGLRSATSWCSKRRSRRSARYWTQGLSPTAWSGAVSCARRWRICWLRCSMPARRPGRRRRRKRPPDSLAKPCGSCKRGIRTCCSSPPGRNSSSPPEDSTMP